MTHQTENQLSQIKYNEKCVVYFKKEFRLPRIGQFIQDKELEQKGFVRFLGEHKAHLMYSIGLTSILELSHIASIKFITNNQFVKL